jgi:glutathione S-transferase
MSEFTIHGIPGSPYLRSALLGLEEKGAPYRLAAMGFGDMGSAAHRERHPFGRMPTLDHGDFRLYETQAILRYLDGVRPEPALQPEDPQAAARMNQIIGIVDWYVFRDISMPISWQRLVKPAVHGGTPDEAVIAAALPKARICVAELERLKGRQPYMAGDRLSLADLMLAPHLDYFAATPEGAPMLHGTSLLDWLAGMRERPSMQATQRERLLKAA